MQLTINRPTPFPTSFSSSDTDPLYAPWTFVDPPHFLYAFLTKGSDAYLPPFMW